MKNSLQPRITCALLNLLTQTAPVPSPGPAESSPDAGIFFACEYLRNILNNQNENAGEKWPSHRCDALKRGGGSHVGLVTASKLIDIGGGKIVLLPVPDFETSHLYGCAVDL